MHKNFKGQQSASIVKVTYANVPVGSHFIYVKFIKDSSQNSNNDSVQFKISSFNGASGSGDSGGSSGGGDAAMEDALITRTLTSYTNSRVTNIGNFAFCNCNSLTSVSFPACTSIGICAFSSCSRLTSVNFPACTTIDNYAFKYCSSLSICDFGLTASRASFIGLAAFHDCSKLTALNLHYSSVIKLSRSNAFYSTPMSRPSYTGSFGSIYVPASLVNAYKSATNWVTYSSRITAIVEN